MLRAAAKALPVLQEVLEKVVCATEVMNTVSLVAVAAVLVASVAQLLTSERVAPAAAAVAAVPKAHRIANLRVTTDLNHVVVEVV